MLSLIQLYARTSAGWRKKFEFLIWRQNNLESKIFILLLSPYKTKRCSYSPEKFTLERDRRIDKRVLTLFVSDWGVGSVVEKLFLTYSGCVCATGQMTATTPTIYGMTQDSGNSSFSSQEKTRQWHVRTLLIMQSLFHIIPAQCSVPSPQKCVYICAINMMEWSHCHYNTHISKLLPSKDNCQPGNAKYYEKSGLLRSPWDLSERNHTPFQPQMDMHT